MWGYCDLALPLFLILSICLWPDTLHPIKCSCRAHLFLIEWHCLQKTRNLPTLILKVFLELRMLEENRCTVGHKLRLSVVLEKGIAVFQCSLCVCVLCPQLPPCSRRSRVTNPRIWAPTWPWCAPCRATPSPGSPGGGWMGLPSSPGPWHSAPAGSSGQALWPSRVGRLNLQRTEFHKALQHLQGL